MITAIRNTDLRTKPSFGHLSGKRIVTPESFALKNKDLLPRSKKLESLMTGLAYVTITIFCLDTLFSRHKSSK